MNPDEQVDKGGEALRQAFWDFFDPLAGELKRVLEASGFGPLADGGDRGSYGFALHVANRDEKDAAAGYGSVDVTITGHERGTDPAENKRLVLWFVRFGHHDTWKLMTRNGYLDWLLLGETHPTQGVGPRLHVAIQQMFPERLEHRDWLRRRH